jgi:hypothetical protein
MNSVLNYPSHILSNGLFIQLKLLYIHIKYDAFIYLK